MSFFKKNNSKDIEGFRKKIDLQRLPVHIAIIMDGNGRWAKKRNLPRNIGHKEGAEAIKRTVLFSNELGINHLTVYAFSTENWSRPKEEVNALMKLLNEFLDGFDKEFGDKNIRIRHIGDPSALSAEIQTKIKEIENRTKDNSGLSFNVALNYGGRFEITQALKNIVKDIKEEKIQETDVTEAVISKYTFTKDIPDPDLIIRTSGEYRLSNFLIWQSAYSELWFDDVLWPDFDETHLLKAITDFQDRERRYGGI
ncbi:MAG: isoprenyl transferase [Deltaproteobacteria bacterium]